MPKHSGESHSVNSAGATARCQQGIVGEAMAERPADTLPPSLPPRGLSRVQCVAYIAVGPTKFDEMVADRRMPKPKRIDGRVVWDRLEIDEAFAALPSEADSNPWDEGVT